MTRRLDNALGLYMEGIRDGNVREAIHKYTGERYIQHSTGVANGAEGFIAFFEPFMERHPKRDIQVLRSIEDGRHVFCHVSQDLNDGEARWITADLFDTDEDGRIIEHWDVIAPWLDDAQIDGPSEVHSRESTEHHKDLVGRLVADVLIDGAAGEMSEYVSRDLIQHERGVGNGARAWAEHLAAGGVQYRELFRLVGDGNFVVTYCKVDVGSVPYAVFDVFRLEDGLVVERWTNAELVPEDTGNSGKF